ncbi:MAG: DEAD/DEAH box helicase [Armatimonadota bacterium]
MAGRYLTTQIFAPLLNKYWRNPTKFYWEGYNAFTYRQAHVLRIERSRAVVQVSPTKDAAHLVEVSLKDGQVEVSCDCPRLQLECSHKIAAFFELQRYLQEHPPCIWQQVLEEAVKPERTRKVAAGNAVIAFSLYSDNNATYTHITPHSIARKHLPSELPEDGTELAQVIHRTKGIAARPVYTRSDFSSIFNATPELIAAMGLIFSTGTYYSQENSFNTLIPLLKTCPVFLSDGRDPLARPVTITDAEAVPEVVTEQVEDGMRLTLWLTLDGRRFQLAPGETMVLGRKSGWVLNDASIFRIAGTAGLLQAFLRYPEIIIPFDEMEEFSGKYLTALADQVMLAGEFATSGDVRAEPVRRLYLREDGGEFVAELRFGYAEYELTYASYLPETSLVRHDNGGSTLIRVHRNPQTEMEAWKSLSGFGLKRGEASGSFVLRKSVTTVDFLLHQVPKLAEAGFEVYGEEALTSARVNRSRPTISFAVSSGIDWFDVQAVVHFGELEVSLQELRRALHRRERYVKLADGTIGALPEDWLARYRRLLDLGEPSGEKLRLSAAQITAIDALLDGADAARVDEKYEERRRRLHHFDSIEHRDPPRGLTGEMRSYQQAGYEWLHFLHDYGFGGCLADDMGTGKTIQALALLQSLRESGHATTADLVVVPRSLIFNWQREAERFAPGLRVLTHADADRDQTLQSFAGADVVLTTYGILLRDIEQFRQYAFHYVILDESQAIKNPVSQTGRAVRLLCGDHRLVLTGTPVENNATELWSQFAFLNPGLLGSLEYFRQEFATPIEKGGNAEAATALRRLVFPFILRRTKEQVASELPPRTERTVYCEMEPPQHALYEKTRDRYRAQLLGLIDDAGMDNARMKILEGLLRLRQICNHPRLVDGGFDGTSAKFDELLDLLETLRAEGHKALVFSQFTRMLKIVRESLDARGIPYEYLDGQTKDRQARVDAFQENPDTPFFLISLKAGGVGLNLTAADYVIHIDPWWNPAVEMQASDRAHRIGQEKPVFIYKLIMKDSVEEKILLLQERKRELVRQLISTDGGLFKSLTRDDVAELFS